MLINVHCPQWPRTPRRTVINIPIYHTMNGQIWQTTLYCLMSQPSVQAWCWDVISSSFPTIFSLHNVWYSLHKTAHWKPFHTVIRVSFRQRSFNFPMLKMWHSKLLHKCMDSGALSWLTLPYWQNLWKKKTQGRLRTEKYILAKFE